MNKEKLGVQLALRSGLIAGAITILLSLIGMITTFGESYIISKVITFGELLLVAPAFVFALRAITKYQGERKLFGFFISILTTLLAGIILLAFVVLGTYVPIRDMFVNASDNLFNLVAYQMDLVPGLLIRLGVFALVGVLAAGYTKLQPRYKHALTQLVIYVILIGLMSKLIGTVIANWGPVEYVFKWMFSGTSLSIPGALVLIILVGGLSFWRYGKPKKKPITDPKKARKARWVTLGIMGVIILLLPSILGMWFSEILDNVGLFILMGLGLNIVIGFAGLLDLGYVAFYAIGAYTIGVLTSPEMGFFNLTFWQAFPIALACAVISGVILGLPILKMRGDYLAIVTLGFGEIIRLLALSDWLRPYLGGTQGIQRIERPVVGIGDFSILLESQQELYYLILIGIIIVAFVAIRLRDSRLGRSWMALREDEDVAVAMGINHVATKLTAFAMGALFSGIGGTIFAAKIGSIYPSSFSFIVSINILALIIVGGMGSIPGVFVGALALMGLPEILREFSEYRYLFYGAALVAVMLVRPEGLWPEARRKLELHEDEAIDIPHEPQPVLKNPGQ